jgi:hypothetical protein
MKTAMGKMIEFLDGMLGIEDNLVIENKDNKAAVEDIKRNWEQLNTIKGIALILQKQEKNQITKSFVAGVHTSASTITPIEEANDYFNNTFK